MTKQTIEQLKEETAREFDKVYNEENPLRTANSGEENENIKSLLLSSQQQAYNLAMERVKKERENLLDGYTEFLLKHNYTDTDVIFEEPKAVDRFLSSLTTDKNINKEI